MDTHELCLQTGGKQENPFLDLAYLVEFSFIRISSETGYKHELNYGKVAKLY
jgi:hypothetical protein